MKPSMVPLPVVVDFLAIPSWAAERHMMQASVPADKLTEARALTSPLLKSPETVEQGKALYGERVLASTVMGKTGAAWTGSSRAVEKATSAAGNRKAQFLRLNVQVNIEIVH